MICSSFLLGACEERFSPVFQVFCSVASGWVLELCWQRCTYILDINKGHKSETASSLKSWILDNWWEYHYLTAYFSPTTRSQGYPLGPRRWMLEAVLHAPAAGTHGLWRSLLMRGRAKETCQSSYSSFSSREAKRRTQKTWLRLGKNIRSGNYLSLTVPPTFWFGCPFC